MASRSSGVYSRNREQLGSAIHSFRTQASPAEIHREVARLGIGDHPADLLFENPRFVQFPFRPPDNARRGWSGIDDQRKSPRAGKRVRIHRAGIVPGDLRPARRGTGSTGRPAPPGEPAGWPTRMSGPGGRHTRRAARAARPLRAWRASGRRRLSKTSRTRRATSLKLRLRAWPASMARGRLLDNQPPRRDIFP